MMPRRPGLSRGECLLSLIILLLVGGLVITAISRTRESAARMSCANNLKQLSLGIHASASASDDKLPPLVGRDNKLYRHELVSVFADLAPFLEASVRLYRPNQEQADAYHAHSSVSLPYHNKEGTLGTQYGGDANQVWRRFIDPSDATANQLRDVPVTQPDGSTGYYAAGSYAANGLLPWNTKRMPLGSAETIIFAERPRVCRTATGDAIYNLWGVGFYSPQMPTFATLTPDVPGLWTTGQVAPVLPLPDEADADRDSQIRVRVGTWNAIPQMPDFTTPLQRITPGGPCDPRLPGFPHRAGMQAGMADGSVRLYAPNTTPWVFWAACVPTARGVAPEE